MDVSLELRRGEALGVIGKNGAGKSTLLSLLNGIFRPDEGRIEVRGRVGALIQLGAGFHPMLTGRENIYVNGAILGLKKREIDKKLDAIIDFAGIGEFIDSPIRNYSSGMFARLGFSVAVHADPDVLLVDEVLSVGDAEFRARAMERMWQLREEGVAVVFVSHNMLSVSGFCSRLILLERGRTWDDVSTEAVRRYVHNGLDQRYLQVEPAFRHLIERRRQLVSEVSSNDVQFLGVNFTTAEGSVEPVFRSNGRLSASVELVATRVLRNVVFTVAVRDPTGLIVFAERSRNYGITVPEMKDRFSFGVVIEPLQLKPGHYILTVAVHDPSLEAVFGLHPGVPFEIVGEPGNPGGNEGFFFPFLRWNIGGREGTNSDFLLPSAGRIAVSLRDHPPAPSCIHGE